MNTDRSFFRDNILTILLFAAVVAGALSGIFLQESVKVVKPFGDIFMNILFTVTVPLVFFTVSSSICRLCKGGKAGRTMFWTLVVLIAMILLAGIVGYVCSVIFKPVSVIPEFAEGDWSIGDKPVSFGDSLTSALSVPDFPMLFSIRSMLPMIVIAALTGCAASAAGEKASAFSGWLDSASEVFLTLVRLVMYASPLGLGCYFACVVADTGKQLVDAYLKVFFIFCMLSLFYFVVVNSVIIFCSGGKSGLLSYWKHIIPPSLTALASGSSAVAMPGCIDAAREMGVDPEIAEAVIPFGTNVHKDGSLMGAVMKVVFLIVMTGGAVQGFSEAVQIISIAVMSSLVMGAVPVGAMTGELLICSLLGLNPMLTGVIVIIGTIIDMPATMINSSTNVVAAYVVDRIVK